MRNWLNDPTWAFDEKQMMIKREYKNFDFCICERIPQKQEEKNDKDDEDNSEKDKAGSIIFVLENKFKSIPYIEQLERYQKKILDINGEFAKSHTREELKKKLTKEIIKNNQEIIRKYFSKTKYVLLNLATGLLAEQTKKDNTEASSYIKTTANSDLIYDSEVINAKWHIVTYADYAACLKQAILNDENWKDENGKDVQNKSFYKELINKYCEFIQTFSTHINTGLNAIKFDEKSNWSILCNDNNGFQELRCNDVWQKLVMHKCAQHLISKIDTQKFDIDFNSSDKHIWEEEKKDKLYIGIGFYHGEAFLEYKYRLSFPSDKPDDEKEPIFCLQQQGNNTLSVGVVVRGLKIPKKKDKKNQEEENKKWNQEVENKVGKYYPTNIEYQSMNFYSYQGDYCSFFYYHLAEEDVKNSICKDANKKEYSICKTLDKMVELMNIATKGV